MEAPTTIATAAATPTQLQGNNSCVNNCCLDAHSKCKQNGDSDDFVLAAGPPFVAPLDRAVLELDYRT